MKIAQATPGPWQVEDHAPLRDGQHFLEVATPHTPPDGGYPMLICTVQPTSTDGSRGPDPEQTANARLIALAPRMAEAVAAAFMHAHFCASVNCCCQDDPTYTCTSCSANEWIDEYGGLVDSVAGLLATVSSPAEQEGGA